MKRKYSKLTLSDHIEIARKLRLAIANLEDIRLKCGANYPKNHKINNLLRRILYSYMTMDRLKYLLDDEYHNLISNEEFEKYGHIYYDVTAMERTINLTKERDESI